MNKALLERALSALQEALWYIDHKRINSDGSREREALEDLQETEAVIDELNAALSQQEAAPTPSEFAGACYDFMGWLTTRDTRLTVSATDNASPAADAVCEFLQMRGIPEGVSPNFDWHKVKTTPVADQNQANVIEEAAPVAPAEATDEPISWIVFDELGIPDYVAPDRETAHDHINAALMGDDAHMLAAGSWTAKPVYLRPAVALSDEQIDALSTTHLGPGNYDAHRQFARAIEAALKGVK